jgi:hypothetical protein
MEQGEVKTPSEGQPGEGQDLPAMTQPGRGLPRTALSLQVENGIPDSPRTTGTASPGYVYALGRVEPRCPRLAVEKEFAQVTGRTETAGLTDRQALHAVLGQRQNRYLARQLCWVFTIEGLETYILQPRDPADLDLLVDAVRPTPSPLDVDVIIGVRGPIAPPELCNGLMVPIVVSEALTSTAPPALGRVRRASSSST